MRENAVSSTSDEEAQENLEMRWVHFSEMLLLSAALCSLISSQKEALQPIEAAFPNLAAHLKSPGEILNITMPWPVESESLGMACRHQHYLKPSLILRLEVKVTMAVPILISRIWVANHKSPPMEREPPGKGRHDWLSAGSQNTWPESCQSWWDLRWLENLKGNICRWEAEGEATERWRSFEDFRCCWPGKCLCG